MAAGSGKLTGTRQFSRWMRLIWVVGLWVGCTLTPSPSPMGRGERPSPPAPLPLGGEGSALTSSPSPLGRRETLTPYPSPLGRRETLTPYPSPTGRGEALPPDPSPTGRGEALTPDPSPKGRGETLQVCEQLICVFDLEFAFQRPIQPPGTNTVDPTYRYGSTQNGQREVHHGVEFINKAGVPVYAVADGEVVFAGEDQEISLATKRGFYGKVIILKHQVAGFSIPIYTVYGHLLNLLVEPRQKVRQGDQIGEVGLGGVAAGTHLHFEVRYGKNEYQATRNPELWLPPALPDSGVLLGRFLNSQGECLNMENIVLEPLGAEDSILKRLYLSTYEDPAMRCLQPWQESFGINDLTAGRYRLSFIYSKPETLELEIEAGKVTYLNIRLP